MSLLPILLDDVWDEFDRPLRILDRDYGLRSEDPFESYLPRASELLVYRPRQRKLNARRFQPYEIARPESFNRMKGASIVKADKDKFHVTLDVQHFSPEEVSVKVVDNTIVVEGKHEEKQDDQGWVSRQFLRKYMVPSQCDVDQVRSNLSSDGILTITVPRKPVPAVESRERVIEIQHTGKPALQESEKESATQPAGGKDKKGERLQAPEKKSIAAA